MKPTSRSQFAPSVQFPVLIHCAETIKGGIATYLSNLLPLQRKAYGDERIVLLLPNDQQAELSPDITGSIRIHYFPAPRGRLRRLVQLAIAVNRMILEHPSSVLHAHSTFAGVATRVVARIRNFKGVVVYCAHGWAFDREGHNWLNQLYRWIECQLAGWCDRVICISRHDFQVGLSAGIPGDKMTVVFNALTDPGPIPVATPLPWSVGKKRLLFVGRFDRQKGVDVLVDAMRRLQADADCIVVGAGVWADAVPDDWPSNMHRMGWLTPAEIAYLLQACDALVVPSRWEGFGLVALEAMRAGKPVFASAVGGLREVVKSSESGVLFNAGDSVALAAAITAHSDVELREMGYNGRRRFLDEYQIERLHGALNEVYRDCYAKR